MRRAFRRALLLFPMAQGFNAKPETSGELFLGHAEPGADRLDIDLGRYVRVILLFIGRAFRISERLFKPPPDTVERFVAHDRFLFKDSSDKCLANAPSVYAGRCGKLFSRVMRFICQCLGLFG